MMIHNSLHPRDDVDSLYVLRKEVGRGVEYGVEASIQTLEDYIEIPEEDWLKRSKQITEAEAEQK